MFGARILILIPHPDDEVVGAALAIRRATARGCRIWGLDLTHGVPGWRGHVDEARVAGRRQEALLAAAELGIERIADDGLPARTLRLHLAAARKRASELIERERIDTVWVPAYEGAHADHDAASALGAALARDRSALAAWEFAEYNHAGGRLRSNVFPAPGGGERRIDLVDEDEGRWKSHALSLYRSERRNLANVADGAVFRECFRPLPAHDYARPPHSGRLFYERFHWVPFRHPRIDPTRPAEVSRSIVAFLSDSSRS